jgi:hypothetical protein
MGFNNPRRSNSIWLLAHNKGDDKYKSAVQQLSITFPLVNTTGVKQTISFPEIGDQRQGIVSLDLKAISNEGARVSYYVKEGPAIVEGSRIFFTKIPPRTKFPVKVSIVAWQYGIAGTLRSAEPVEQSFYIIK